MRKIISFVVLTIFVTMLSLTLVGCKKQSIEVELELINPITGEPIKQYDTIELPKEERREVEVRIINKETGKIVQDEDLPLSIWLSLRVSFSAINEEGYKKNLTYRFWPTWEEIEKIPTYDRSNEFEAKISFDSRPDNPCMYKKDTYESKEVYIRFYILDPNKKNLKINTSHQKILYSIDLYN